MFQCLLPILNPNIGHKFKEAKNENITQFFKKITHFTHLNEQK